MPVLSRKIRRTHRHKRIRARVTGTAKRPRLAVFRSAKHISCQLIDDTQGKTLLSVSDAKLGKRPAPKDGQQAKVAVAEAVGKLMAEQAKAKGITMVVYDVAGYKYHGRVKALADGARAGGLQF